MIAGYDLFAANPTLRFKQKSSFGSIFLGTISLAILALFYYLISKRINDTINLNGNQISYSTNSQINTTLSSIDGFMFAMRLYPRLELNLTKVQEYFSFYIQYWDQERSQLQIQVLTECVLEKWSVIGQNYEEIIYENNLLIKYSFCPANALKISQKNFQQNLFKIYFSECQSRFNKNCKNLSQYGRNFFPQVTQDIPDSLNIYLTFLTKTVIINNPNVIQYYPKSTIFSTYFYKKGERQYYIFVKKNYIVDIERFRIEDSKALISLDQSSEDSKDYMIGNTRVHIEYITDFQAKELNYLQINFQMTENVKVYSRQRSTIDQIISDIGGIIQLVTIFLALILGSYNQIKYELTIAGSFFNYNTDGKKFTRKHLNIWTYTKLCFFDWVNTFCMIQVSDTQTKIMSETMQEACQIIDVENLFRKLEYLQRVIEVNFDPNMLKLISILKPIPLAQLQNQRRILSYYQNIIQLQSAATVQDAIACTPQSFRYLTQKNSILESIKTAKKQGVQKSAQIKNQLRLSLAKDIGLDERSSKYISHFPIIAENAQEIQLDHQDQVIQSQITKAFLQLNSQQKKELIMKMPILILHRIRKRAIQQKMLPISVNYQINQSGNIINRIEQPVQTKSKSLKKRIKKNIKDFICSFDLLQAQPLLRTNGSSEKSTFFFGFVNFLVILIFFYLFVDEIKRLTQFDSSKVQFSSYIKDQNGPKQGNNFMMAIKIPDNDVLRESGWTTLDLLSFSSSNYITNFNDIISDSVYLVPCKSDLWRGLGQNYYSYYTQEKLFDGYCFPAPLNISIDNMTNSIFLAFQFYLSRIVQVQPSYYNQVIKQYHHFPVWIYYLSPIIQPDKKNPFNNDIKMQRFAIQEGKSQFYVQTLYTVRVITDKSIWPYIQDIYEEQNYSLDQMMQLEKINVFDKNVIFYQMLGKVQVYERKLDNVVNILSYIGGLFGFVVIFFGFFFESYNNLRYQLSVGQASFSYDSDGKKFIQKKLNFLTYIQYSFCDWVQTFLCYELKWKNVIEMKQTLQEVSQQLDIQKILNRLIFFEKVLRNNIDKNIRTCLALVQYSSIQEVKQKRRFLQYCGKIVKMKQAASVQDAINKDTKSFSYLQNLKTSLNKHKQQQFKKISIDSQTAFKFSQKQKSLKSEIYQTLIDYLGFQQKTSQAISEYPIIAQQAQQIQLDSQFEQIQRELTIQFLQLDHEQKNRILFKIPLIIIHRLRIKAIYLKKMSKFLLERKNDQVQQEQLMISKPMWEFKKKKSLYWTMKSF